ncbi:MAG: hypothetical protein N2Z79_02425, partial [Candidatus Omnitrophica bacterium]|nr:hypothetical protein [Candidatus Omnitrophota bacterium]
MRYNIQEELIKLIKKIIKKYGIDEEVSIILEPPPSENFGDLTCTVSFGLSKFLRRPPLEVAKDIVLRMQKDIQSSFLKDYVSEAKAEGQGFINFYFCPRYFYESLRDIILKREKFFRSNID